VLDLNPHLFCVLRENAEGTERLLCLHNVSAEAQTVDARPWLNSPQHLPPFAHTWVRL
jgi:hypothetical protein